MLLLALEPISSLIPISTMILRNPSQVEVGTILYGLPRLGPQLFVDFPLGHFHRLLTILQADLEADPVVRGRHIVLQSKDCHALWVSSKVIEISLPLPDVVEGGVIVRDDAGHPTGELCHFLTDDYSNILFEVSFWIMRKSYLSSRSSQKVT